MPVPHRHQMQARVTPQQSQKHFILTTGGPPAIGGFQACCTIHDTLGGFIYGVKGTVGQGPRLGIGVAMQPEQPHSVLWMTP